MLQRYTTLLVCLLLTSLASFAQDAAQWQKVKLDAATVAFPGEATQAEAQGQQVYTLNDGTTLYMALVQKDAYKADATSAELREYYQGVSKGMLESAGGGEVVKQSPISVAGFEGVEVQFTTPTRPELPPVKFMRTVLVNGTGYTLNYWTSAEHGQTEAAVAERTRFFTSLEPGAAKAAVDAPAAADDSSQSGAYKLGRLVGNIAFYVLLGAGLVWLVRRFTKSKSQPRS